MAFTCANSAASTSSSGSIPQSEPMSHQLARQQQNDTLTDAGAGSSSDASLGSPSSHPSFPAVAPLCKRYPTQASAIFQTYLDLKNGAAAWDVVEPLALSSSTCSPENNSAFSSSSSAASTAAKEDLSTLSDAEAQALISQTLGEWKSGVSQLGLVSSSSRASAGNSDDTDDDDEQQLLSTGIAAIKGRRKDAKTYEIVIPLTITQHLRASQLSAIFKLIDHHANPTNTSTGAVEQLDTSHILLAIIAPDSTLVYYLLSKGMVKPVN